MTKLLMARAWLDLGDAGWGRVRQVTVTLEQSGYTVTEVRGDRVWLRLAGSRLDVSDLWVMPP